VNPPANVLRPLTIEGFANRRSRSLTSRWSGQTGRSRVFPIMERSWRASQAAAVLLEEAEHASLGVVGNRGHGGFGSPLLGSVS